MFCSHRQTLFKLCGIPKIAKHPPRVTTILWYCKLRDMKSHRVGPGNHISTWARRVWDRNVEPVTTADFFRFFRSPASVWVPFEPKSDPKNHVRSWCNQRNYGSDVVAQFLSWQTSGGFKKLNPHFPTDRALKYVRGTCHLQRKRYLHSVLLEASMCLLFGGFHHLLGHYGEQV